MGQLAGFHQNLEICVTVAEFVEKMRSLVSADCGSQDRPPFWI
jgi:hypothetical protein